MKLNLKKKIENWAKKTVKQVTPTVKKEVAKVVATDIAGLSNNFVKSSRYILVGSIMIVNLLRSYNITPTRKTAVDVGLDTLRNFNITYNEVHVTNNYYQGGKGNE